MLLVQFSFLCSGLSVDVNVQGAKLVPFNQVSDCLVSRPSYIGSRERGREARVGKIRSVVF